MTTKKSSATNQIEFEFATSDSTQLKDIPIGGYYTPKDHFSVSRRVAPVKFLVHSTMVHEVLTRGDCFVVNVETGMLTIAPYSLAVTPLNSKLVFSYA